MVRDLGTWKKEQEDNPNGGGAELVEMVLLLSAASMRVFVFPKWKEKKAGVWTRKSLQMAPEVEGTERV